MNDRKTAAELMSELGSDKAFLEREREQEDARKKIRSELLKAEAPLVSDLRSAGVDVESVWDLVDRKEPYPSVIPLLFEHAKKDYPDRIREGIIRALGVPSSRERWGELVEFFEKNSLNLPQKIRHAAAFALSGAADDSVIDDVIRLISNDKLGEDRIPLLLALMRSKNPKAKMLVLELRNDPCLGREVKRLRRIGRLK